MFFIKRVFAANALLLFASLAILINAPLRASQIGQILVCYACQNTGNAAVDAALANNPGVASDGILFAFTNTSDFAITGGVFSLSGTAPADSFSLPAIPAGSTFILVPGVSTDIGVHPTSGLFSAGGPMDTSDGAGGVNDTSIFKFTGLTNGLAVSSLTAGTSTAISGTFTPGDPGLFKPFRDVPTNGITSFVGDGPSGDGGCSNCYFDVVATLNTPDLAGVPEPSTSALLTGGMGIFLFLLRKRKVRTA